MAYGFSIVYNFDGKYVEEIIDLPFTSEAFSLGAYILMLFRFIPVCFEVFFSCSKIPGYREKCMNKQTSAQGAFNI